MKFPIDLSIYKKQVFTTAQKELGAAEREQLLKNIEVVRDSVVFFTALANSKALAVCHQGPCSFSASSFLPPWQTARALVAIRTCAGSSGKNTVTRHERQHTLELCCF